MTHFDEVARRIQWSKIEFSHSLAPLPNPAFALVAVRKHFSNRKVHARNNPSNYTP